MSTWQTHFGSWLKVEDLQGRSVPVTIARATVEDVAGDRGSERKLIVAFANKTKRLILNKTNAQSIAQIAGDDPDRWPGATLTLYPATTSFGGRTVPCIRIRPVGASAPIPTPPPLPAPPPLREPGEDDADAIPF